MGKIVRESLSERDPKEIAEILRGSTRYYRKKVLGDLSDEQLVMAFRYMDNDEIVDILQLMDKNRQKQLIDEVNDDVKYLMQFNPQLAAGIMNLDYIIVDYNTTFGDVARLVKKHLSRRSKAPVILVRKKDKIIGEVSLHKLIIYDKNEPVVKHITKLPHVYHDDDPEEILEVFRKNPHSRVIVLGREGNVIGVVHAEDMLAMSQEMMFNKLYSLFGVRKEEDALDPFTSKVKHRLHWLIINLFTAFLAAGVVVYFEDTIARNVILAAFMPIIAGMGGNSATQTLGVIIRGLALNEISLKNVWKVIVNEIIAGIINGFATGIIVAIAALLIGGPWILGLVTGLALVGNLVIAAIAGTIIPPFLEKFGSDPAASATVIITTATDVGGFFLLLGLANWLL